MSLQAYIFRHMCTKSDKKRDFGLEIPDNIMYIRDIKYGSDDKYNILDICYPKNKSDKKLPLIISIHGGGYVYGTKEIYQFYCADLARRGFAVINFNYRLAPKYKFPAPLEDLQKVIDWIVEYKDRYPVDLSNTFLVGDSAGAQLASQYGAIYSNEEYRKIMRFKDPEITIRALGLCCGTYDLKKNAETEKKGLIRDYLGPAPEKFGEKLNVLNYITADFPPSYLFSSGGDFLREECAPMAELLKKTGVEAKYRIYGDELDGHVFHVNIKLRIATKANDDQMQFFKEHIK